MIYCNLPKLIKEQSTSLDYIATKVAISEERLQSLYDNSAKNIDFEEIAK